MRRTTNPVRRDKRGVVYVEFLMVFFPLLLLFLGIVQLALIRAADLVVQDAALRGARTAIVTLDDDPKRYGNAPRGSLVGTKNGNSSSLPVHMLSLLGLRTDSTSVKEQTSGGPRLQAIRNASYVSLAVLAPSLQGLRKILVGSEIDFPVEGGYEARFGLGFSLFNRAAAAITVHDAAAPAVPAVRILPDSAVTVRVSYLYYCGIPLVSQLICRPAVYFAPKLKGSESPRLSVALLLSRARFVLLEAEATLPNQSARYHGGYEAR